MGTSASSPFAAPHRAGALLGVVQFLFVTTWTVYVLFLPQLAKQAGIEARWIVWILMLDQLIFTLMDFALGVAADRVGRAFGKLGRWIALVTVVSCAAFLSLPFIAPMGSPVALAALMIVWSLTSSALRAPPMVLLGKYAPAPQVPWLASLALFGLGAAGAFAPYLTVALRDVDPRLPFAAASISLALATVALSYAERVLGDAKPHVPARVASPQPRIHAGMFLACALMLGLGFQVHSGLNSAPAYLRFAKPADLEWLMPIYWVGFNLILLPAGWLLPRVQGLRLIAVAGIAGCVALAGAASAGGLASLIAAQLAAGAAWGCIMLSAVSASLEFGRSGREGRITGAFFSLMSLAAFTRIAFVAAQLNKNPDYAGLLQWLPASAWGIAAVALLFFLARAWGGRAPAEA